MASTIIHLAIAEYLNTHYYKFEGQEKRDFLLGSVIVDCQQFVKKPKSENSSKGRMMSHFVGNDPLETEDKIYDTSDDATLDFRRFTPNIERYTQKYGKNLNDPFFLGVYNHLWADVKWFEEFMPDLAKKNIDDIKKGATSLSEITNKDYRKWTKQYMYNVYDDLDLVIPVMELGILDKI